MAKVDHINHAIVAKTHTSMYLMHKYWARKPHNVVREYIEHYSEPGDIVLDPFCGSGVTATEALKTGRKAIAIDLDPISTFITECTAMDIDIEKFEEEFEKIKNGIKKKIDSLYLSKCARCGKEIVTEATIWNNEEPIEIRYSCGCKKSKKSQWKSVDIEDKTFIRKVEGKKNPYWYPDNELIWNTRVNVHKGTKVSDLFTNRNLSALATINNAIDKITNKKIQKIMKFTFSSALPQASKMVFVYRKKGRDKDVGGWATRGYWMPPEYFEINAWNCFEERFKKVLRGKTQSNDEIKNYNQANDFGELNNDKDILIKTQTALELENTIGNGSVDYIFTDPPYGDAVPYLELNYMWASWLKMDPNFEDEIILSDSPARDKRDFDLYHKMLKAAFRQMFLVLKPEKYLTVTFHNTDIKVWNSIIRAVVLAGFDLEKILYQKPARASAKGLLAPYGSAVGDYYIRFKKPKVGKLVSEKQMGMKTYEMEVVFAAKVILEERGEPTIYQHILNGIMVELKGGRYVPVGARNIEEVLKDHVGEEFELIDIIDKKGKKIGSKWWLKDRDFSNFSTPSLSDRVERSVLLVLDNKVKASFDDIIQEIFIEYENALTPDSKSVTEVLEEYARKTSDGKWMLKPGFSSEERINLHNKMIYSLGVLGKKAGFKVWIGLREQGEVYNKTPLRELCDKIPTFRYISQEKTVLERVKNIDVLWVEDGRIKYVFEVENTTGISGAIIRGSNIPENLQPKRFIVIPEEREKLLHRKLQEPILKESIKKVKWDFIRYKDLESLYKKTKKQFNPHEIEKISKDPKLSKSVQKALLDY